MEKPFASLTRKPLAAPFEDMEEIVIATLNGMQFRNFTFTESPKTFQATREDAEIWANHTFKKSFSVEVSWLEDPAPPEQFQELSVANEFIQPILVSVKVKDLRSDAQDEAQAVAITLWNQLKERASQTSEAARTRKAPTDHGSASWATLEQLQHEDYVQESTQEDISSRLLVGTFKNHTISVPKPFTEAHAIVAGPPGVGKSRTIFIPNLIERLNTSAIVTEVVAGEDIKPLVYKMTAGYRAASGHKVFYINPSDLDNCTRFNPIDFMDGIDDAIYYADLIITNTSEKSHSGDQIWKQSETHLLTALLLYAWGLGGKQKAKEGGLANLGHVRSILRFGPITLNRLIKQNGIPEARDRFDEFIRNSSPNFRLGVFSGLIQRLNPWLNPKLIKLTEVSDFTQEDLRQNLFTFYLAYPVHRQDYKPIMALALNFLTKLALRESFDKPLTLLLDEFAAYGSIPGIDILQATIRNRGIGIVLGFQDQQQLQKVYSTHEAEVLFTNTDTKVLFATGSQKTQQQISQMLGRATRVKKQVSSSGHINRQTYGAPLLEPGEVGSNIKQGEVLVIRNKRNPIILKTCDPGKYNAYEHTHPAPQKPKKYIDPKIFDDVKEAQELTFSQQEANAQIAKYQQLWKAKMDAQEKLVQAKKQGVSGLKIKTLEQELTDADEAFNNFVAPEPGEVLKEEPEDKQFTPKQSKVNAPVTPSTTGATISVQSEPSAVGTAAHTKSDNKPPEDTDPYDGLYAEDSKDPFESFYAEDESQ